MISSQFLYPNEMILSHCTKFYERYCPCRWQSMEQSMYRKWQKCCNDWHFQ